MRGGLYMLYFDCTFTERMFQKLVELSHLVTLTVRAKIGSVT